MLNQIRNVGSVAYPGFTFGAVTGSNKSDGISDPSLKDKGPSTAEKVTIGAVISFISTKIIWAFLIARRKWRGRGGKDPDRIDRFVDWCWKWSTFLPRFVYRLFRPTSKVAQEKLSEEVREKPVSVEVSSGARTNSVELKGPLLVRQFTPLPMWGGIKVKGPKIVRR